MSDNMVWKVVGSTKGLDGISYITVRWDSPTNAREAATRSVVALEEGEALQGAIALGEEYDAAAHAAQRAALAKAKAKPKAKPKAKATAPERARKDDGTFQGDDPDTPETNEAFAKPAPKAAAPKKAAPKAAAPKKAAPKKAAPKKAAPKKGS